MSLKVIGVRQLRDELASVMAELSEVSAIIVTQHGEGRAVLMQLDRYNELIDRVEYLEDTIDALTADAEGAIAAEDLPAD